MPTRQTQNAHFLSKLRAMDSTGAAGFEGYVRDCLEESLGSRFRLMKSGHQDGADIRSDAPANYLQIAVEGKRYGNATPLPTEELQLKIVSAAQSGAPLDLWVLVTTRTISATDRINLEKTGDNEGVATAVLDAADGAGQPSALSLLAANAPEAFARHFSSATEIAAWLDAIRNDAHFTDRLSRILEPFGRIDVGYAAARNATSQWLVTAMSDEATARARLDSFAGLEADGAIVIPRPAVEGQLDAWLESGPLVPLAILGDEGVGKTWSLLGWWRKRMRQTPDRLPLTLVVAASAIAGVGDVGGPELIARLLHERFPIRSMDFWRRRLALWAQAPSVVPRVLLVIDGLNQQPEFVRWQQILQPLFDRDWKGLFAAAITCRQTWWDDELKGLPTITPGFQPIQVPGFNEAELDDILARFNLGRSEFTQEMQRILAIPRYCQLVIRRREELAGSGDITVERLIYEDWRHRISRVGAGLAPTEEDFRAFIGQLGARLRAALDGDAPALTRRELIDTLDRDTGHGEPALRTALSEIIDGKWMRRESGGGRRFTLNPLYVPFALALALHDELRGAGHLAAPDRLATFMDPLRGTDRGTAILRNAFTIAVLDRESLDWVFELLLDAWFNQQNFGPEDATALGQLAPAAPERFLAFAERLWSGDRTHLRDDTNLIGPIVRAAGSATFRQALRQTLAGWLCRISLHPEYLPRADRASPDGLSAHGNAMDASAAAWVTARDQLGDVEWAADVAVVRYQGTGNLARLTTFAAGLLSFFPRADFLNCYVAWAVSRAIVQDRSEPAIEWTLRVNDIDPVDGTAAILAVATTLSASPVPIVAASGKRLLDALATPAASEVAVSLGGERYQDLPVRGIKVDSNGMVALSHESASDALGDYGLLREEALNPDRFLAPAELMRMRRAAEHFDVTDVWASGRQRSRTDVDFEHAEIALARWAPDLLASVVRRAFRTAPERMIPNSEPGADSAETRVSGLVRVLQSYWPVLGAKEMAALRCVAEQFLPRAFREEHREADWLRLQIPRLFGRTAAEQIEMLASDPNGPSFFEADREIFSPLQAENFPRIAELLAGEWGPLWLGYLLFADHRAMPAEFEPLYPFLTSDDLGARKRVQLIFRYGHSPEQYRRLVESGWRWNEQMDRDEGATGSLNLFHASKIIPVPDLADRVDPELWGAILADSPEDGAALERFTAYLEDLIRRHRFPGTFGSHHWLDQEAALRVAASRNTGRLVAALDKLIESDPHHAFGFDSFPVIDLIKALCTVSPAEGARLWNALWPNYGTGSWSLPRFEQIPFLSTDPIFSAPRDRVLGAALSDARIETVVTGAAGNGHLDWLLAQMDMLFAAPTAGEIARGLTIARFLDPSSKADAAWQRAEAIPLSEWLGRIRSRARTEYNLGRIAQASGSRFMTGSDPDQQLADLILFKQAADTHDLDILRESADNEGFGALSPAGKAFWLEWDDALKAAAKKSSEGRDKRYLYDEPPKTTHWPWHS